MGNNSIKKILSGVTNPSALWPPEKAKSGRRAASSGLYGLPGGHGWPQRKHKFPTCIHWKVRQRSWKSESCDSELDLIIHLSLKGLLNSRALKSSASHKHTVLSLLLVIITFFLLCQKCILSLVCKVL